MTELEQLAIDGELAEIRHRIDRGRTRHSDRNRLLIRAVQFGHVELVRLLVGLRDDLASDPIGNVLVRVAFEYGRSDVLALLRERGVGVDALFAREVSPQLYGVELDEAVPGDRRLAELARSDDTSALTTAVGAGAPLDHVRRALGAAVSAGNAGGVRALLAHDPSLVAGARGVRLLHTAVELEHVGVLAALVEAGVDINAVAEDGMTALHHAVDLEADAGWQTQTSPGTAMIEAVLAQGADCTAVDADGRTARELAIAYEHNDAITLLDAWAAAMTGEFDPEAL